ncbi:T9SS type A sorting domain-containing protein [Taibaiella helva]|uniref:T9SS type A sorting domain-containing protein n=1 Tax=Taibaiella helva TaxID=2301235 RepID=UPI000E58CAD3|nr:T9SS type A sorting domain-containing protein [Taibaiella helva]
MKRFYIAGAMLLLVLLAEQLKAQCSFTPTVTPNNMVLCATDTDTLWTQVYDNYQWYRDGAPVAGATQQYLVVDGSMAGSYFKVSATQASCTEMSDSVLVDGWMYLPPFAVHDGNYQINPNDGSSLLCEGRDTMLMHFSYPISVQWYKDGSPIPGANSPDFYIYEPGSYSVSGAPAICPTQIAFLGVTIDVAFIRAHIIPENPILCPGALDTLSVDSGSNFEWYKDGVMIPGATAQELPVSQVADAGSWFHVTATVMGCNTRSDSVLVDSWVFAPISVSSSGNFTTGENGEAILCTGDTLFLEVLSPYTESVQWFRNGTAIPGANSSTFTALIPGEYTVEAAPMQCPDFLQNNFGLPLTVAFRPQPDQPVIVQTGSQLSVSPSVPTVTYQWYKDGELVPGATGATYDPAGVTGSYTVKATDGSGCSNLSAAFNYNTTAIHDPNGIASHIQVYPNPAKETVFIQSPVKLSLLLLGADGAKVMEQRSGSSLDISRLPAGLYILELRDKDNNFIKAEKLIKLD